MIPLRLRLLLLSRVVAVRSVPPRQAEPPFEVESREMVLDTSLPAILPQGAVYGLGRKHLLRVAEIGFFPGEQADSESRVELIMEPAAEFPLSGPDALKTWEMQALDGRFLPVPEEQARRPRRQQFVWPEWTASRMFPPTPQGPFLTPPPSPMAPFGRQPGWPQ